jgi:hypothetical protein
LTDPSNAAAGHLDLLTTVMHEMGHELGLPDTNAPADDLCRGDAIEPEVSQFQRFDEHINRPNRIAPVHPIIKAFRQQRRLLAIHPLNETLHHSPSDSARES